MHAKHICMNMKMAVDVLSQNNVRGSSRDFMSVERKARIWLYLYYIIFFINIQFSIYNSQVY